MSEPKRYEIRTVDDFVAIPADKINACLTDFQAWLSAVAIVKLTAGKSVVFKTPLDAFTWIDDGKHIMTVTVADHEGKEWLRSENEFAPPEQP